MIEILEYVLQILSRIAREQSSWIIEILKKWFNTFDEHINGPLVKLIKSISFKQDLPPHVKHYGDLPLDQQWEREKDGRFRYKSVDFQQILNESKMIDIPEFLELLTLLDTSIPIDTVDMKGARRGGRSTQSFEDKIRFMHHLLKKQRTRQNRRLERWAALSERYKKMISKPDESTGSSQATRFLDAMMKYHMTEDTSASPNIPTTFHLIQDFDQIQQYYLTALEESKDALQDLELQYPFATLGDKLQQFCDTCIKRYYWAPFELDAYYRSINSDLFGWNDADPFLLNLTNEEKETYQSRLHLPDQDTGLSASYDSYALLPVLSMASESDRSRRRKTLLQPSSTNYSLSNQEVIRLSGVLGELLS
mmetsp:Transcript_9832/g.14495  ORF Transcript_9832/g.14495 Transcript_9832/m.14495 type:complete len:365 (+) Transcript_9832:3-1097(+)